MTSVDVARDGTTLVVTINRPDMRNAINREVAEGVHRAVTLLDEDDDLRVGILTGAGGHFSSGMDLREFAETGRDPVVGSGGLAGIQYAGPDKPLIAAVEGYAVAGGLELALCCDLVVAGASAQLGLPEVRRGLIAGGGGLVRLSHRLPRAVAMELALTGEPMSARRATELGLVNRVVPDGDALDAARQLATVIAACSPAAVQASKAVLIETSGLTEAEAWRAQEAWLDRIRNGPDAAEGATAFVERREARWE